MILIIENNNNHFYPFCIRKEKKGKLASLEGMGCTLTTSLTFIFESD
jgi:hypothetical protein